MNDNRLHELPMPAYLDREVSSNDRDKFGHAQLSAALRDLVEEGKHRPPYSIGLLGKWGTGKSTVKELYLNDLTNDEAKDEAGVARRDRIYSITFNAWKYGGEPDIRRSLFRHILLEIGGTHEEADRQLFKTTASTEHQARSLKEIGSEFLDQYAIGLFIVLLFGLLFFGLLAAAHFVVGLDSPIDKAIGILGKL